MGPTSKNHRENGAKDGAQIAPTATRTASQANPLRSEFTRVCTGLAEDCGFHKRTMNEGLDCDCKLRVLNECFADRLWNHHESFAAFYDVLTLICRACIHSMRPDVASDVI